MKIRLVLVGVGLVALALAQAPENPAFDVVSIRPHELPRGQFTFRVALAPGPPVPHSQGNHYARNVTTLENLVTEAYGVYSFQLSGVPDWGTSAHFDVDARSAGETAPSAEQLRLMLQRMLADRFQLKLHRETRPVAVYALVVKNRAKIREISKAQYDNQPRYSRAPERYPETTMITMPFLANSLRLRVDRPVLDETKLTGYYEIATPEWMQPRRDRQIDREAEQSEVLSELESADGLKLEARKDSFEVLVVDHVEQPSVN